LVADVERIDDLRGVRKSLEGLRERDRKEVSASQLALADRRGTDREDHGFWHTATIRTEPLKYSPRVQCYLVDEGVSVIAGHRITDTRRPTSESVTAI
jgi:hypothetical protein